MGKINAKIDRDRNRLRNQQLLHTTTTTTNEWRNRCRMSTEIY